MEVISNSYNSIKPVPKGKPAPEKVVSFSTDDAKKNNAESNSNEAAANAAVQNNSTDYASTDNAKAVSEQSSVSKATKDNEEFIKQENERIKAAVSEMNKKMVNNSEAVFGIHEETNRVTIKIVDKESKKVIKELPPEKTLDMIAKVWEMAGLLVDEKR
ncbi:MAG: flagellar protein FlaG [Butyrivibrio sp.]|nr:flagellar protein FlaG [Butyrivibrio sp.]